MNTPSTSIRILICEDQRLLRESLRIVLDMEPGLHVVGEANDGVEAVQQAFALRPDIILMDIKMPRLNGVEATAAITTRQPDARIIALTTFDNDEYVFSAIESGAMAYLLKDMPAEELIATIWRVHKGERFIQPSIASAVLLSYSKRGQIGHDIREDGMTDLSDRETDVLRLLARGESNREIADNLVLAEGTVKNYVSNILLKLHASNRTHAATIARERGII
jgi:two-component system, NarL family, response regulator DegU